MGAGSAHAPDPPRVFMNPSGIVAPAMPRRTLWVSVAVVLALHLWALHTLSLPVVRGGSALPAQALRTRVLPAPAPSSQAPGPASPSAAKRPPQRRPAPVRRSPSAARTSAAAPSSTAGQAASVPGAQPPAPVYAQAQATQAEYERWLADLASASRGGPPQHARTTDAAPASPPSDTADLPPPEETPPPPAAPPPASPREAKPPPLILPPPARLSFEVSGHVKGFNYHARGELAWETDGTHYQARQSISMLFLGSRAQQSNGLITARGLQPERFVDEARQERSAQLDAGAHRVWFSDGATAEAEIGDGVQDRLSVFIQLGALIAAAPGDYPPGTRIRFETVGPRRVDRWTFEVQGPQLLHLPAGDTPALQLRRLPQEGDEQTDELWLGTDLNYLPVRIRLSQGGGDFVDLQLRGHETP